MFGICAVSLLAINTAAAGSGALAAGETAYVIDQGKSQIVLGVFREGILKVFGHDHTIEVQGFAGTVHVDTASLERSTVALRVESKSLAVVDPFASEKERHDVQLAMDGAEVLNVAKFPEITFRSTGVSDVKWEGADLQIMLAGELSLHGVQRRITIPMRIRLEHAELRATGEVFVAQKDFGITPIRVAGGMVRVKDQVKVSFDIRAVKGAS